jgi:hypothetical protein
VIFVVKNPFLLGGLCGFSRILPTWLRLGRARAFELTTLQAAWLTQKKLSLRVNLG